MPQALDRGPGSEDASRTRRSPRIAMTVGVTSASTGRRSPACPRGGRLHHVGLPSPPLDGDRHRKSCRPVSAAWRPTRGPQSTPGTAQSLGVAAFSSCGAGRLSCSNFASAASRSASSKTSQRLTPVTVRPSKSRCLATRRRSPRAKCRARHGCKTAPRSLSRCTTST